MCCEIWLGYTKCGHDKPGTVRPKWRPCARKSARRGTRPTCWGTFVPKWEGYCDRCKRGQAPYNIPAVECWWRLNVMRDEVMRSSLPQELKDEWAALDRRMETLHHIHATEGGPDNKSYAILANWVLLREDEFSEYLHFYKVGWFTGADGKGGLVWGLGSNEGDHTEDWLVQTTGIWT